MLEPDINERMAKMSVDQNPIETPRQTSMDSLIGPPVTVDKKSSMDSLLDAHFSTQNSMLMDSMAAAMSQDPDVAAKAQKVAKQINVGPDVAARNLREVERQAQLQDLERRNLSASNPILARQLSDPQFASIAHDDVKNLLESDEMWKNIPFTGNVVLDYLIPNSWKAQAVGGVARAVYQDEVKPLWQAVYRTDLTDEQEEELRGQYRKLQSQQQRIAGVSSGMIASPVYMLSQMVTAAPTVAKYALTGATAGGVAGVIGGPIAPATMTGGMILGGSAGVATGFAADSFDANGGEAYFSLRDKGYSRQDALRMAIVAGGGMAALDVISLGEATAFSRSQIKNLVLENVVERMLPGTAERVAAQAVAKEAAAAVAKPTMAGTIARAGKEVAVSTLAETVGEISQDAWAYAVEVAGYSLKSEDARKALEEPDTAREFVAKAVDTFIETAQGAWVFAVPGAAGMLMRGSSRVAEAERAQQFFQTMSKNAADSKVRMRNPSAYEAFIAKQAEGTKADTVYIDAAQMENVLQQANLPDSEVDKILPGLRQSIAENKATGGDVTIPTAKFAAQLAGTPLGDAMLPHVRLNAEAISVVEAQEAAAQAKQIRDQVTQEAGKILGEKQKADAAFVESANKVEDDMRVQLVATGKMTESDATTSASIYRDFVVVRAAQMGISPEEFHARYGQRVQGEQVAAPTAWADEFDQAGQRNTDTPEFKSWFGQSKVVDAEGKPLVVYHGTNVLQGFSQFIVGPVGEYGRGIYFATSPDATSEYAGTQEGAQVIPTYVAIQNPLVANKETFYTDVASAVGQTRQQFMDRWRSAWRKNGITLEDFVTKTLKAEGYDGVVVNIDGGEQFVVAFDPKQIKSVFNRGTWSATDPNILNQEQSTRLPSGRNATEDPLMELLSINWDITLGHEATLEKNMAAVREMPNWRPLKGKGANDPKVQAEAFVNHMVQNLLFLHDAMPEEWRQRARLWYDGARKTCEEWAKRYGITEMQAAAVIAVLSPQNPWFLNMSQAERVIDIVLAMRNERWDAQMDEELRKIVGEEKPETGKKKTSRQIQTEAAIARASEKNADGTGKTLAQLLSDPLAAAVWVRVYDQVHNTRKFRVLTPEGGVADWSRTQSGREAMFKWGSYQDIAKAISVILDGRAENVFYQLGEEHKVRNFYNNIFAPNSQVAFGTMDTHAGAAALMRPLSGKSKEIVQLFGGAGSSGSLAIGQNGLYPLFLEAYRRAAQQRGLLTREMQSITWEAVRGLFEAAKKKGLSEEVDALWWNYRKGKIDQATALAEVFKLANGITAPEWTASPFNDVVGRTYDGESAAAIDARGAEALAEPDRDTQVLLEVAPDPSDIALTERWNKLTPAQKMSVSKAVANVITTMVMKEFGVTGQMSIDIGGYLGSTNPSISLRIDSPELAVQIAKALGYVLSQDSMTVVSDTATNDTKPNGAITIALPDGYGFRQVEELYKRLWKLEHNGEKVVTGHLTSGQYMTILMPVDSSLSMQAFRKMVDDHLGGEFVVDAFEAHSTFVSKKEYGYARTSTEEREGAAGRPSTPARRIDRIREEATALLERGISGTAESGGAAPDAVFYQSAPAEQRGAGGYPSGSRAPLAGAPRIQGATGPDAGLVSVAEQYAKDNGITLRRQGEYATVDAARAKRIADAYEAMPHAPQDPVVKEAYQNLIKQTMAQYRALEAAGYKFYFYDENTDPYAGNPWNAMRDLRENRRMAVFASEAGFGSGATDLNVDNNPLLEDTGLMWPFGSPSGPMKRVLANDLFRAVHDAFGHGLEGAGFRAQGEENAWQAHVRLFTGSAVGALTSETRGQNSWLNYGPFGEKNQTAKVTETTFADQKTGLMPEWTWTEGRVPDAPEVFEQAAPAPGPRGGFDPKRLTTILTRRADLSTFLHESAHYFLTITAQLASSPEATAEMRADMDTLLQWFGIAGSTPEARLANWNAMSVDEQRKFHEQFAYSFEVYLSEGRAPSVELQGAFDQFRRWLTRIYKSIRDELNEIYKSQFGIDLPIMTGEVRQVMDRMLSSEAQIQRAEAVRGMKPMFQTKEESGMSDAEWAAYTAMNKEATDTAVAEHTAASVSQMQWLSGARSRILRALQAQHNDRRREVRKEVQESVAKMPVYRAMRYLRTGEYENADGTPAKVDAGFKMSREGVDEILNAQPGIQFENGVPRVMPGYVDPLKISATMTAEEGVHPDVVAGMFGFGSGHELLHALVNAKPMREEIDSQTDARMEAMYGDMNTPQAREEAVARALHNEARARFVAVEYRLLSKSTAPVRIMLEAARQVAEQMIADKKIRDLRPGDFTAAEARAAREAEQAYRNRQSPEDAARAAYTRVYNEQASAVAAGLPESERVAKAVVAAEEARQRVAQREAEYKAKYAGATPQETVVRSKRAQLLQNQLAAAALKAQDEARKGVRYMRNVLSDANRKRMGADAADQIAALLDRFDLRPMSNAEAMRRKAFAAWISGMREAGLNPEVSPEMENEAFRKPYRELTVNEFRDLIDTIKQIEYMGKNANKILAMQRQAQFEAERDAMVLSVEHHAGGRRADTRTPITNLGRTIVALKGFFASHLKAAAIARILDGGQDNGPVWNFLIRTANVAGNMETRMRAQATEALTNILAPVFAKGKMGGAGIFFPTIGRSLNREARIAIALNMGNAGNIQRLLDGEGWSIEQLTPVLESLTADEWNAVQAIWDHLETYRPMIADKERRLYGKEPKWIEPQALTVKTSDGQTLTLRGGYYPIKYDQRASLRSETMSEADEARRDMKAAMISATTRRSFTKSRANEVVGRPLLYTLDGLYTGVNEVIHDLSWHEWLIDANRLMRSTKFTDAVRNAYGPEYITQLRRWIEDVAAGEIQMSHSVDRALGWLRQNVSAAGLGYNLMSAATQVTGFANSIVRVGAPWIARGVAAMAANPRRAIAQVQASSEFMQSRARTQFRELAELKNMVRDQTKAERSWRAGVYFLMMQMQRMVDVPTWLGAYEKALADGQEESQAVALADQAVIDSQGGGQLKDLSAMERGGQAQKLFTVFYSYMNTVFNQAVVSGMTAKSKGKLASDMLMLFVVPVVLNRMIREALTPGDDQGDEYWKKLAQRLAEDQISYLMGTMVVVREFNDLAKIVTGGRAMGYSGPSGLRPVGDALKFAQQASQAQFDTAFRKAAINLMGDMTGLPSGQINRAIDGIEAIVEGDTKNPLAPLTGYQKQR